MPYCPICGTDHDPDLQCGDRAAHVLRRAGIKRRSRMSPAEFQELSRKARRSVIIGFGLLAGGMLLGVLYVWLFR